MHKTRRKIINFPKKKYKTIYADPPWYAQGCGSKGGKRGADKHYSIMKTADIKKIPVETIADESCWLFMWVTNNHLKDGLEVMEHWGFRYITNFVWTKERFGLGYYFRGQHELCLFGIKGNLKPIRRNVSSLLVSAKRKHSQKPIEAREMIETMSYEPRIELFARDKINGWDFWGDEV